MPLTSKGQEILKSMEKTYGSEEKAKSVLYASKNAGKITGIDAVMDAVAACADAIGAVAHRFDAYLIRSDDRRVIGGVNSKSTVAEITRVDVSESDIEPKKLFWLKRQRPLPSGKTVRLRVNIMWKEKDGRWLARIVTPGLYQGGNEKVGPEDLE